MKFLELLFVAIGALACANSCASSSSGSNATANGFDASRSDPRAVQLAELTLEAMGGREAWERARVLTWTFFKGDRKHVWDKWTNDLRLEDGATVVLMNLGTEKGRVFVKGVEVTDPVVLAESLERARRQWINDSYWLLMPYKLKDAGVKLGYVGPGTLHDGREADVISLTFEGVGVTPLNKYHVWIGRETNLVEQWSYFENAADAEPKITTPWSGWASYSGIMLSGQRGARELTGIAVSTTLTSKLEAKLKNP